MDRDAPRRFQDFSVKLTANGAEYRSIVEASPAGRGEGPFAPPVAQRDLESLLEQLSADISGCTGAQAESRIRPLRAEGPRTFGESLGEGFFQGDVERRHAESRALLRAPEDSMRIGLHLKIDDRQAGWLGALPWELLRYDQRHLLLDPSYSLARCLDLPGPRPPLDLRHPLKVLVVVARPAGMSAIDSAQDVRALKAAFRNSPTVKIEVLKNASAQALGERLRKSDFHVVHFIGHSGFDSAVGKGHVLFETEEGAPDPIEAEIFAELLRGEALPRLVVLNACGTASFSARREHRPWNGMTMALLKAGVSAVVAMQFPISDDAAIAFSRGFYGPLAAGNSIDLAVARGRRSIFVSDPHSLEWATPALWLRAATDAMFQVVAAPTPRRTVVIEVERGAQAALGTSKDRPVEDRPIPDEETLLDRLATLLGIAPTDLMGSSTAGQPDRFLLDLPADAADRLRKTLTFPWSRLRWNRAELPISSIDARPTWRWPKAVVTLVAAFTLLVAFATFSKLIGPKTNPERPSRVELDLATSRTLELRLGDDQITTARQEELRGLQRITGRAVLDHSGSQSLCDWAGKTDRDPSMSEIGAGPECTFTLDLPASYDWIYLRLAAGGRTYLFTVRVQ